MSERGVDQASGELPANASESSQATTRSTGVFASLAAIGSAVLASGCCLPLFPFLAAAGAAGGSAFFVRLRPFLVVTSVVFLVLGFYQGWRAKKCNRKPTLLSTILLWSSACVVVAFTLFPQVMANLIADLAPR